MDPGGEPGEAASPFAGEQLDAGRRSSPSCSASRRRGWSAEPTAAASSVRRHGSAAGPARGGRGFGQDSGRAAGGRRDRRAGSAVARDAAPWCWWAAVLGAGLDPVVGALVRRGWRRGRAALAVFAGLFASVFALRAWSPRGRSGIRSSSSSTRCRATGTGPHQQRRVPEGSCRPGAPTTPPAIVLREAGSPRRARMAALRGS